MANVLIIDDDIKMCEMISHLVRRNRHQADYAHTMADGLKKVTTGQYDVVFLDVGLPDGSGLEILTQIRVTPSSPEVIIITGIGDPDGAEIAIKKGAWDYIQKPLSPRKITLPLNRVLQYRDSLGKIQKTPVALKREHIIGSSSKLMACLDYLAQAASTDANIMITGETGTGKELFAKALHDNSRVADQSFIVVDCATLPETLIESSLFGYEKGAFTGADSSMDGLIKLADGGTLSLDEVGELSLKIQKAFLRVLQERRYRPVGGKRELTSKFRLVSTTNRDLDQMVKSGQFRKDLLYRIRTISIELPPLRERLADIKAIAVHHTIKICDKYEVETRGFSSDFFDILRAYHWPGNVRELINVLEETINNARQESTLFPKHLPSHIRIQVARALVKPRKQDPAIDSFPNNTLDIPAIPKYRIFRETVLSEMEKNYFQNLMKSTRGDIQSACELSGLSRSGLYAILKRYNISRMGWPTD